MCSDYVKKTLSCHKSIVRHVGSIMNQAQGALSLDLLSNWFNVIGFLGQDSYSSGIRRKGVIRGE